MHITFMILLPAIINLHYLWKILLILAINSVCISTVLGTFLVVHVENGTSSSMSKLTNYNTCTYLFTVDCGVPDPPQRGSLESYTVTTEGSEVFYRCNQHLVPEGRMRANCTRNGWSPLDPGLVICTEGTLTGD